MSVFGGTPRQLIFNIDSAVSFAPDGNRLTFLRWLPDQKDNFSEIHITDKDGGNDQVLYSTGEKALTPVWSPDGSRIAWIQTEAGTTRIGLKVMEIASKKLTTVGPPAGISWVNPGLAYTTLAWMPDSRHLLALYYRQHTDRAQIGFVTVPSGEFHSVTNDVNSYSQLALSGNGRTLATVLTNFDSSIALYGPDGGEPVSTLPLRITPNTIAWGTEDRLLYVVGGLSIGTIDRATGSVQSFDTGETAPGDFIASCPDGHILFTGFPKGEQRAPSLPHECRGRRDRSTHDQRIRANSQLFRRQPQGVFQYGKRCQRFAVEHRHHRRDTDAAGATGKLRPSDSIERWNPRRSFRPAPR